MAHKSEPSHNQNSSTESNQLTSSVGRQIYQIILSHCLESSPHILRVVISLNKNPMELKAVLALPEKDSEFNRIARRLAKDWCKAYSRFGLSKITITGSEQGIQDFSADAQAELCLFRAEPLACFKVRKVGLNQAELESLKNPLITVNGETLSNTVENSLPHAVRLVRFNHYIIKTNSGPFQLISMEVSGSSTDSDKLNNWKKDLERQLFSDPAAGIIVLKISSKDLSVNKHLGKIAGVAGVLNKEHLKALRKLKRKYTKELPDTDERKRIPAGLVDLSHVPFVAIDSPLTRYREDLVHVQKLSNGELFVRVAITDVTWLITPGSEEEQRIKDIRFSVFGSPNPLYTVSDPTIEQSNFALNKKCPSWVFAFIVNKTGEIIPQGWGNALVASHKEIDPANPTDELKVIAEAGELLFARRMQKGIVKVSNSSNSRIGMVLAELMVATKVVAGEILRQHTDEKIAPIYRVQLQPDQNRIRDLAQSITEKIGVEIVEADFFDPIRLTALIRVLDETSNHAHLQHMIDAMFGKSSYSLHPSGHAGIGIDGPYVDLKARALPGYYSQAILKVISEGNLETPFPNNKPAKIARTSTRNKGQVILELNYRFVDRLIADVEKIGETFSAKYLSEADNYIEVAGLKRWGILLTDQRHQVGEELKVVLSHYDLKQDRLVFRIDPEIIGKPRAI